jgi:hAT family protein
MDYCERKGWEPEHIAHIKCAIQRVVEQMHRDSVSMPPPGPSQSDTAAHQNRLIQHFEQDMMRRRVDVERESELRGYLAPSTIHAGADVLTWWRLNAHAYPCLARIARDYLAIPATSAPVERVFSGGADLITKKRGSLSEDTIRDCMCLRSWVA